MSRCNVIEDNPEMKTKFFEDSVREWYSPLYRFAVSLCRDPEDAADLTQNAFYKLATKGSVISQPTKIKSWLFSVVHREFIDEYRKNKRRQSTSLELVPEPKAETGGTSNESRMDSQRLLRALDYLEDKYRLPLTLFYMEHFSYKEIADFLKIPVGTVMSRLRRGKDQLKDLMENKEIETKSPSTIRFPGKDVQNG